MSAPTIAVEDLLERYAGFMIDAYGVLVDGTAALEGAVAFLERLRARGRPFVILSNDASRLPETAAGRYRGFGLPIDTHQFVSSGSLLPDFFARTGLHGQRCIVLGPEDSERMVTQAGGRCVAASDDTAAVVVVCDDAGFSFLPTIEATISTCVRRLDQGLPVRLVLPNPDLTYPKRPGEVGLTAGSIALLIEAALDVRFGAAAPKFEALGKPHRPLFEAGLARLGLPKHDVVMLGDQLGTDIAGARGFGIDSVLVGSGLGRVDAHPSIVPTWQIAALNPG